MELGLLGKQRSDICLSYVVVLLFLNSLPAAIINVCMQFYFILGSLTIFFNHVPKNSTYFG